MENVKASAFSQNEACGGFESGEYHSNAVHPVNTNWTRQSRFAGPNNSNEVKEIVFPDMTVESSIVVDEQEILYFTGDNGVLYAVSSEGTLIWEMNIGLKSKTPVISRDGKIILGTSDTNSSNNKIMFIDRGGKTEQEVLVHDAVNHPPVLTQQGMLLAVLNGNKLCAFNKEGVLLWTFQRNAQFWCAPTMAANGVILIGCNDEYLYCLDIQGHLLWSRHVGVSNENSNPIIYKDGSIIINASIEKLRLIALDEKGNTRWEYKPDEGIVLTTPALSCQSNLYFFANFFRVMATDINGNYLWAARIEGYPISPPIVDSEGIVYACTSINESGNKRISRITAIHNNGATKWLHKLKGEITEPVLLHKKLCVLSNNYSKNYAKKAAILSIIGDKKDRIDAIQAKKRGLSKVFG